MTVRVKEAINGVNPIVAADTNITEAIVKMTEYGFGAITVVNKDNSVLGVFTDGALRRLISEKGRDILTKKLSDLTFNPAISVEAGALLNEAAGVFKKTNVDTLLVLDNGKPIGMLDIQDMKG
jgi:signal-transduction protein with cAMP-binding, CBS, and nucleotidyltransferase domain